MTKPKRRRLNEILQQLAPILLRYRFTRPNAIRLHQDLNRLNLRYENNREQVRELFPDDMVQTSVDLDLDLVTFFDKELGKIEWKLKKHAQKFNSASYV